MLAPRKTRRRAISIVPAVMMIAVLIVATPNPALASGSWVFASSDHLTVQISWGTDNGGNAQYEVFTLTQPVKTAQCGSSGPGQIGQPDGTTGARQIQFGAKLIF